MICRWLVYLGLVCLTTDAWAGEIAQSPSCDVRIEGDWYVAETGSFFICSLRGADEVRRLALQCEQQSAILRRRWLAKIDPIAWNPKCHVVLHSSARSYFQEVGQSLSAGASLIDRRSGQIVSRRIDLRADHPHGFADALIHELTHVIVADRFVQRRAPPWADEGMALLGDSRRKRTLHAADLATALRSGRVFDVEQMLNMTEPARSDHWPVFYAQSLSLVEFLVARADEATFIKFLEDADRDGYADALIRHYQLASLDEFEQQWLSTAGG